MLDNLYKNIGTKIKNWAKWMFIIETIGAIITGFAFLIELGFEDGWWALFIIAFGPIVAWVSSWLLYAFGEFVEDIHAIRYQTARINNIDKNLQMLTQPMIDEANKNTKQETKEKAKRQAEAIVKQEADTSTVKIENSYSDNFWICGKCNTKNLNTRSDCWSCGKPK